MIYLPAEAQHQLYSGIDALAAPGSRVAVEDGAPMDPDAFAAAVEEERNSDDGHVFFQLVYNERYAPADQWFAEHGWTAVPTPLADYLYEVGRPVPGPDTEAGPMVARNTLVSATKG
jgi:O-methyltransferase involved in polyketide biosynthesis